MRPARHPKRHQIKVYISHSELDTVFARHVRNLLVQRVNAEVFTGQNLSAAEAWQSKLRNEVSSTTMPVSLESSHIIELADVETPENAEKFVVAFEESLAAAHIA